VGIISVEISPNLKIQITTRLDEKTKKVSMNKKRLTVLALMMALLMVLSIVMLVACNKGAQENVGDETTVTIEPTKGLLISNGDFKVTKGNNNYPMGADGWTGAAMYSSGSYPKGVIAGVVSLEEALYTASMSTWKDNGTIYGKLKSHYSDDEDAVNNALMIYMPTKAEIEDAKTQDYGPTAYGFTSTSFNLESNKYYKLSVDVLTYDIKGALDEDGNQKADAEPGARIYVSSATYAEYANINTNGEWATYTFYFESAVQANTALTVQLGLGKYNSEYTVGLTSGYAFFDNLLLEEVERDVYTAEKDACENGKGEITAEDYRKNNQTHTLKVNNGRFDYGTTKVGTTAAASNWKVVTGTDAVSGLGKNGIIDVANFAEECSKYASTYYVSADGITAELQYPASRLTREGGAAEIIGNFGDNRIGTNVYMLSQQRMTAQGLQSTKPIVIEKGKHYAISVSVYTYDIHGAGVTLTLSGEGEDISIKGISQNLSSTEYLGGLPEYDATATNGGWTTYTFYIEGNQYMDYSYTMTFWLGTGGKYDNNAYTYENWESSSKKSDREYTTYLANGTFSTGWAFFDELNLEEIDHATYVAVGAETGYEADANAVDFGGYAKVSLHTTNLFTNISANFSSFADNAADYDNNTLGTPEGFSADELFAKAADDENLPAIDVTSGVVSIADNADFTAYGIENPGKPYNIDSDYALMFKANSDSYFFYETEEFAITKNSYYRISLWVKTVDVKATAGLHVYLLDSEDKNLVSFASINTTVEDGEETTSEWTEYTFYVRGHESEDKLVSIKIDFGTGDRWTSATLADGAAFVANMSMTAIDYSDYTGAKTGSTVKSVSLVKTSVITNSFDNGGFNSYDVESEGLADAYGILENSTKAASPTDWTLSDKTYKPNGDNNTTGADTKKSYTDDNKLVAGIVKLDKQTDNNNFYNASNQITNVFGSLATEFNTLYGAEDDTYFDNVEHIGAPYVLALAGLDGNKYSRRFTSDSFSLSAGNNYEIKVWVKTIGQATFSIYLTGGASGNAYFGQDANFVVKTTGTTEWTCYTFYIEVGLTPVSSLRLALGLGYDKEISGSRADADEYSSGIVLFDNVTLTSTTTTDEFDAITESTIKATERKISYLSDGFDVASESIEAHSELTSPSGWKGTAGTDQDSKNTNSGVVYADASTLPTHNIDATDAADPLYSALIAELGQTVSLFGKDYKYTNYDILQSEIEEARANYAGKTDDEIKVILQKTKMYNDMKANYISTSALLSTTDREGNNIASTLGKNFLVINNTAASAYTYTSANYGLNAETFYRVSVWVRTYNVTGKGASVEFHLGSANEKENPLSFTGIGTKEGENGTTAWTKYTFYVKTLDENVTAANIKLSLGEYDADDKSTLSTGYAMFDSIQFEIIEEAEFDNAVAGDYVAVRTVAKDPESGDVDDDDNDVTPTNKFNLEMLTWMIPTIIIAIAIIAVVCVYFYKKLRKPAKAKATVTNTEAINEKRSKYDESNE
jgi:hypothetical protein